MLASCSHPASGVLRLGARGQVELDDTLPSFQALLKGEVPDAPKEPDAAWKRYEARYRNVLEDTGALKDPGDVLLYKAVVNPAAVSALVDAFERAAPAELNALASDVERLSPLPELTVVFAVARPWGPVFQPAIGARVVFNARSPELAEPSARQAAFARELFRRAHQARFPDSASLGPLAQAVFRSGAASLAARQLVPRAEEEQLFGIETKALARLRQRQPLIAKELLASLDSSRPSELARFFDPAVTDPLLAPGAGPYISDRLFQRLAASLSSTKKPLELSPDEFLRRARPLLAELAQARP